MYHRHGWLMMQVGPHEWTFFHLRKNPCEKDCELGLGAEDVCGCNDCVEVRLDEQLMRARKNNDQYILIA